MAIDVGAGKQLITLQDMVGLANGARDSEAKRVQYDQALHGGYILSDQQALADIERQKTGKHLDDGNSGEHYLGLAIGKLPNHPTFSNESPYAVKGFKGAEAGEWEQADGKWIYKPSQSQFDKDPGYADRLNRYYNRNNGNGIDKIEMPKSKDITNEQLAKLMEDNYIDPKTRAQYEKSAKEWYRQKKENPDASKPEVGLSDVSVETFATPLRAGHLIGELDQWGRAAVPAMLGRKGLPAIAPTFGLSGLAEAYLAEQATNLPPVSPQSLAASTIDRLTSIKDK